jgi:hypothetical protein
LRSSALNPSVTYRCSGLRTGNRLWDSPECLEFHALHRRRRPARSAQSAVRSPRVFTVWLRPTATANCNEESVNNVAISLAKQNVAIPCNECVRRHAPQFGRREPHRVQRGLRFRPRTAGRWPWAQCWPEPLRPQATVKRGETIRSLAASARQPNVSCRPALARARAQSRVGPSGPWPSLRQTMAAVSHHHRPGDERGRLVGEKEHARGNLRRRATAPDRSRRRGGGFERQL